MKEINKVQVEKTNIKNKKILFFQAIQIYISKKLSLTLMPISLFFGTLSYDFDTIPLW